jgi:hypothetical protein
VIPRLYYKQTVTVLAHTIVYIAKQVLTVTANATVIVVDRFLNLKWKNNDF